jgi:hypothetical protein
MKDCFENNDNECNDAAFYNGERTSKIKALLSQDLLKQERYIQIIKISIINFNCGNKETPSKLCQILQRFCEFINYFGITFGEIIKKDKELIEGMFRLLFNDKIKKKCQQILLNIMKIYNYSTQRKNFGDIIRERLSQSFLDFSFTQEKKAPTEIELLVEEINTLFEEFNGPKTKEKMVALFNTIKEKENKLNCLCDTDKYFPSTLEYFRREINELKNIFSRCKNQFLEINNGENNAIQGENINDENQSNPECENKWNDASILDKERIILNDIFYQEQVKEESKIPLQKRTFFFHKEKLLQGEDQFTEFKDYSKPFCSFHREELIRQYLGFLNAEGGRIYIGISDSKEVAGIKLNYKERDQLISSLVGYTNDFYPSVRLDKIKVVFIPIKYARTGEFIPDLFVVKIIIHKGDQRYLYTMDNPKKGIISAIRRQTEVLNLRAKEIQDEIIRRSQLETRWADIFQNLTSFNDPELNIIETNGSADEEEGKNNPNDNIGIKIMKKCDYILKISNIDIDLKPRDINRALNGCGCKNQKFKGRDGKNCGEGVLIFDNEDTAKKVMQKLEGSYLGGKNQIKIKLAKSEYFCNTEKF